MESRDQEETEIQSSKSPKEAWRTISWFRRLGKGWKIVFGSATGGAAIMGYLTLWPDFTPAITNSVVGERSQFQAEIKNESAYGVLDLELTSIEVVSRSNMGASSENILGRRRIERLERNGTVSVKGGAFRGDVLYGSVYISSEIAILMFYRVPFTWWQNFRIYRYNISTDSRNKPIWIRQPVSEEFEKFVFKIYEERTRSLRLRFEHLNSNTAPHDTTLQTASRLSL